MWFKVDLYALHLDHNIDHYSAREPAEGEGSAMEEKVVRICWNSKNWMRPSGREGKSTNEDTWEFKNGYGHEEWLFDLDKIVDGYHYAFLQAASTERRIHSPGDVLKIYLYTINSSDSKRWWIGSIEHAELVGVDESEAIFREYEKKGWLDQMVGQVKDVGGNEKDLLSFNPSDFVNIKFKVSNLSLEDEPQQFDYDDPALKATYYNFQPFLQLPQFKKGSFNFVPGHNPSKGAGNVSYAEHERINSDLHNQIQFALYLQLEKFFGISSVGTEQWTPAGKRVDVVAKDKDGEYIFYEIKTSGSALGSIREALPQLLEYAYFPDENLAKKLVIVSPGKATPDTALYLENLRSRFRIPVFYQRYDAEANLVEEDAY